MDLLDIAIATQLVGGGGSGTDNYNELSNLPKINGTTLSGDKSSSSLGLQSEIKEGAELASDLVDDSESDNKFVTSAEKLEWSGKQDLIDNSHKLSSDLVNDADKTNKFVTASEKETWNGKQNLIDNSHKLSSDLVNDADKTNKFVTSTEKNTWNAKQNAIDSDHKLSSSLVSFSEAEAAALASGINSSKVGQISTNQTNILYNLNMGVKNLIRFVPGTFTKNVATFEITNDGKVIINSTSSGSSAITNNYITLPAGTYRQKGMSVSGKGDVRLMNGSTRITDNPFTLSVETTLSVVIFSYATNSNVVITPMLCTEEAYAQSTAYQPPALPNYDLTRLEAEDRASLAEVVDSIKVVQVTTSDFITANTNFAMLPQTTIFKQSNHIFGTLVIQKTDTAKFVDSLATVGTIKSGYRPVVNLIGQSYYNTEQWGVNGFGYSYINTSGIVSVKSSTDSANKYSYVAIPINYMTA